MFHKTFPAINPLNLPTQFHDDPFKGFIDNETIALRPGGVKNQAVVDNNLIG